VADSLHQQAVTYAVALADAGALIGWAAPENGKAVRRRWKADATADPALVPRLLAGARNPIIIPAGPLVVIDVDAEGWYERLREAGLPGPEETLTVETPTDRGWGHGRHIYGLLPDGVGPGDIAPTFAGGETRASDHGEGSMVLGPCARREDGVYRPLSDAARLAVIPRSVIELINAHARAAVPPPEAPAGGEWRWSPDMGSRHDLLRAQVLRWRRDGVTGPLLREQAFAWMQRHGLDGVHDGRRIEDDEIERLCAGAEVSFTEREVGFVLDLEDEEPPAEPLVVEDDGVGFGVRVADGPRTLVVEPGTGVVTVSAFVGGEPAVISGTHAVGPLGGRMALAKHLAEAEGGRLAFDERRRRWLRLVERAIAELEQRTPVAWASGVGEEEDPELDDEVRVVGLVYAGVEIGLVGLRSRLKTQTASAAEAGMLTTQTLDPAFPVSRGVDAVVRLALESTVPRIRRTMRRVCIGAGVDPAVLDGRWFVIRAATFDAGIAKVIELLKRMPAEWTVHLTLDNIQKAIGSLGAVGQGDAWGGPAEAVFAGLDRIRHETRRPSMSCLVLDHGKLRNGGERQVEEDDGEDTDTLASFRRLRGYGSQRKEDGFRASVGIGVVERGWDKGGNRYAVRISGQLKAPEDGAGEPEQRVIVRWDGETGATTFAALVRSEPTFPASITRPKELPGRLYLAMSGLEPVEVGALAQLVGGTDERHVRRALVGHPDAFRAVPGTRPVRWEIVPRGMWELDIG
jgi:hypothetical protein